MNIYTVTHEIKKYVRTSNSCRNLEFWTKKLGTEAAAKTHLILACADTVTDRLSKELSDGNFYHGPYIELIADTLEEAEHYGVNLGGVISVRRNKVDNFDAMCEATKVVVSARINSMGGKDLFTQ